MAFGVAGELLDQVRTNALDGTFNSSEDCEWSPLALGDAAEVLASIGRLAATQLVPSDRKTMHYLRVDGERLQPSRARASLPGTHSRSATLRSMLWLC